jgi:hypothetical protein
VNNLKNGLTIEKKEKATLQEELDKERDFKEEYKHNIKNLEKEFKIESV